MSQSLKSNQHPWNPARFGWLVLGFALLAGCASPPRGLWPPAARERTYRVTIYASGFHSLIGLPARANAAQDKPIEEWAYGERIWFCDDAHGFSAKSNEVMHRIGAGFRALFWPNHGVIELSRVSQPYPQRNPDEQVRQWEFQVSAAGLERLRTYLEGSITARKAILEDGDQYYYPADRNYDLFHNCHHYIAEGLWQAGIPVHQSLCLLPLGFWWQLNHLALPVAPPKPSIAARPTAKSKT